MRLPAVSAHFPPRRLFGGDGFCVVAGCVDVTAALDGEAVAEPLHGERRDDGPDDLVALGDDDDLVRTAGGEFAPGRDECDDRALAALELRLRGNDLVPSRSRP